jgi:hypothetical protein
VLECRLPSAFSRWITFPGTSLGQSARQILIGLSFRFCSSKCTTHRITRGERRLGISCPCLFLSGRFQTFFLRLLFSHNLILSHHPSENPLASICCLLIATVHVSKRCNGRSNARKFSCYPPAINNVATVMPDTQSFRRWWCLNLVSLCNLCVSPCPCD